MVFKIAFDVGVCLFQVRVDTLVFHVFEVDPFVMLDLMLIDMVLNLTVFKGPLVDDAEHAVDAELLLDGLFLEGCDSTKVEIALVSGWVLHLAVDVDDVAAILMRFVHLQKHIPILLILVVCSLQEAAIDALLKVILRQLKGVEGVEVVEAVEVVEGYEAVEVVEGQSESKNINYRLRLKVAFLLSCRPFGSS